MPTQPSFYIPHGGGPCLFMNDPKGIWGGMEAFLQNLRSHIPQAPDAILIVTGHWETEGITITGAEQNTLLYDYYGFPEHTYDLKYPAQGAPSHATRIAKLLQDAAIPVQIDRERGLDHGAFIPLMVAFPEAELPIIEISLDRSLDPALHLALGKALAPLRDENILILATGMSFHNMRAYGNPAFTPASLEFDAWLTHSVELSAEQRNARLTEWSTAPSARICHPQEEHLIPLMVAAGASPHAGERIYSENVLETAISAYKFS